jgi:hypothetical protein
MTAVQITNYCEKNILLKQDTDYIEVVFQFTVYFLRLQIRRPWFDSRRFRKKKVVGLERGLLSLVSTTQELLGRKVAAPV